jgi:hypothetical protein
MKQSFGTRLIRVTYARQWPFFIGLVIFGWITPVRAQSGNYTNLSVSGTTSVNQLQVSGTLDAEGDTAFFGAWSTNSSVPGAYLTYSDGASGTGALLTSFLTRSISSWEWQRETVSGTAMELDASNRLILSGTQSSNAGSILIDPTAGQISINGEQVLTSGQGLSFDSSGDVGIGTATPAANLDVEGSGNVIFNSGEVGLGVNPAGQDTSAVAAGALYIATPNGANIRLVTTTANDSYNTSSEDIDFGDGAAGLLNGEIIGLDSDFPGSGVYLPSQLAIWSGQSGGILFLARNWPGQSGPIVFADGDQFTGEVMRITPYQMVGIGGETNPASLVSIKGNASVGTDYSETSAPQDGMIVEGNVGIGTSNPQASLDVDGNANFSGPVELQPQGDLSMGSFTALPPGGGSGGSNGDAIGIGPGGRRGFGIGPVTSGSSGSVSGTNGSGSP